MPSATTQRIRCLNLRDHHVRAILDGRKTQHRVPVKPQPECDIPGAYFDAYNGGPTWCWWTKDHRVCNGHKMIRCPYRVGDLICGREAWQKSGLGWGTDLPVGKIHYRATDKGEWKPYWGTWRSSSQMPQWAARVWLEVTGLRVERVQAISEDDARAEGVAPVMVDSGGFTQWDYPIEIPDWIEPFADTWDRDYGPGLWTANPWVWAIEWKQAERPEVRQ